MNHWRGVFLVLFIPMLLILSISHSCSTVSLANDESGLIKEDIIDTIPDTRRSYKEWDSESVVSISNFSSLRFSHQSAAAYKDYAVFVAKGRSKMYLYSLKSKTVLHALDLEAEDGDLYHSNQASFGLYKYNDDDYFPVLYVSQRANSDGRCFIEVYRIIPSFNDVLAEFDSFSIELVQTIILPKMTRDNSLGNVNCVIDPSSNKMYTYSRNNNIKDSNYGQCKITQFPIPNIHQKTATLYENDILSSYMINASAINMQGGCIQDGILYIGQGYLSAGYIYLNIVDLRKRELIKRIDLRGYNVTWEPEGCFFYDGSVMLSHTSAISRIDKK